MEREELMKRVLMVLVALAASGCSSVHSAAKLAEENKATTMKFVERVNQGDLTVVDEIFDPGYVDHETMPGVPPTREGLKQMFKMFLKAFPDMKITVLHLVAEGDWVVIHHLSTGTNKGDFMGMPATGRTVRYDEMHLVRFANGKVVEHWGVEDAMTMMQQLGLAPEPGKK
jgi:predicted ester cyclase